MEENNMGIVVLQIERPVQRWQSAVPIFIWIQRLSVQFSFDSSTFVVKLSADFWKVVLIQYKKVSGVLNVVYLLHLSVGN